MLMELPERMKLRQDTAEPICKMSRVLRDEPSLAIPYTLSAELRRDKLLQLAILPRWRKSSTDSTLPRRADPYTEQELPQRTHPRTDREDPMCTKSNTDNVLPTFVNP
jgi:hypothetical protein